MKKKTLIIGVTVLIIILYFILNKDTTNSDIQSQQEITFNAKEDPELVEMLEDSPPSGSFFKIDNDFETGKITIEQMYAYKLVAMFNSSLLKERYSADSQPPLQGDTILMVLEEDFDNLSPEMQEIITPMLLSFSDENSFFFIDNIQLRTEIISKLAQL